MPRVIRGRGARLSDPGYSARRIVVAPACPSRCRGGSGDGLCWRRRSLSDAKRLVCCRTSCLLLRWLPCYLFAYIVPYDVRSSALVRWTKHCCTCIYTRRPACVVCSRVRSVIPCCSVIYVVSTILSGHTNCRRGKEVYREAIIARAYIPSRIKSWDHAT